MSDSELAQKKMEFNAALQSHPEYQSWMEIEEVEKKGHIYVGRFKSPEKAGIDMPLSEALRIYNDILDDSATK